MDTVIRKQQLSDFLVANEFDLYIVNPFAAPFVPRNAKSVTVARANFSELRDLADSLSLKDGRIVGIGAGTVFDSAKYIANRTQSKLTIFPTALSVNAFATNRSSFFDSSSKKSLVTKAPDTIVLDYEIIRGAKFLNTMGIIELLATVTAQTDWRVAIDRGHENEENDIQGRANTLIDKALGLFMEHEQVTENLEQLFSCLFESGRLTQDFGNGRPVSGSEHVISSYIENKIDCPHGIGLFFGILMAEILQEEVLQEENSRSRILAKELLAVDSIKGYIRLHFESGAVESVLKKVRPRRDKYTVLDEVDINQIEAAAELTCDRIFVQ